ncbi:MAG TPA: MqnA/MqnD/SBP family protein [Polyangiaceae bacterium]|nr:MqnA/MqnD/SBP family protein [Polyangiaceae bacterium]
MSPAPIRLAFSPDSDDLFMFWPLLAGKVDAEGLVFEAERADTETLNARAEAGDLDVVAVSIARWPSIAAQYLLLPHGMSVGRGYGPVVVATEARDLASLEGARIAVPGLRTTATMVLRLLLPRFDAVVVPISPYARVFEAVRSREVDAALLIHEGRLTYEREGFARVCDIGEAWAALTVSPLARGASPLAGGAGLPLPLGGNAIRRSLGADTVAHVSRLCRASIAWALAHRDETMAALLERETRTDVGLDRAMLDRYLAMYANADTLDPPPDVVLAIDTLYARAHAAGLLDSAVRVELAP